MFPLHQGNELRFQISPNPHKKDTNISEDLILASLEDHNIAFDQDTTATTLDDNKDQIILRRRRRRNSLPNSSTLNNNNSQNNIIDNKSKNKMRHRDIERLRRQDMATLHASLRSLLPLQFIKGKRSISDHINESVRYIKHLQMKIKDISAKRDGLKKLSAESSNTSEPTKRDEGGSSSSDSPAPGCFLRVQSCCSGVEITFATSDFGEAGTGIPVSRVLEVLLEEGLTLVSCFSTKVNGRFLHTIQSEASDIESINLSALEQKLNEVLPYSS